MASLSRTIISRRLLRFYYDCFVGSLSTVIGGLLPINSLLGINGPRLCIIKGVVLKILVVVVIVIVVTFMYLQYASKSKASLQESAQKGAAYLEANSQVEGVMSTASGLQYQVLVQGDGTVSPVATDRVKVHYHGTLVDGVVFDSSVDRGEPIEFGLNQVIKGWTEGVQLMVVGEKTRFVIPSELAYGNRGQGAIGPGSVLIFEVELLGINE